MRHPSQALDITVSIMVGCRSPKWSIGNPKLITSMANDLETERFRPGAVSAAGGFGAARGRFRRAALGSFGRAASNRGFK